MKRKLGVLITIISILTMAVCCNDKASQTPVKQVHAHVKLYIDSLNNWAENEFMPLVKTNDSNAIRKSFFKGRGLYKKVEFAVEYFFPTTAGNINGAPLPEIEAEEHTVIEPSGFQVLEEMIFPIYDSSAGEELIRHARKLKSLLSRAEQLWKGNLFRDDQVFDALRLQYYRTITLGISGFDMPVALKSINELPVTLNGIKLVIQMYDPLQKFTNFYQLTADAVAFAEAAGDFDSFDRMKFITNHVNPLTRELKQVQQQSGIPFLNNIGALKGDALTLFDSDILNINYFTPGRESWLSKEKIALGERLFYDPILSGGNTIACASCHRPEKAFTDGLPLSAALGSTGFLSRNTPTVINAGLQKAQFYDMRAPFLEEQINDVVSNKDEVHGSLADAARLLTKDTAYLGAFKKAFSSITDSVGSVSIQVALASYIRSLNGFNSRFDKHVRGGQNIMNNEEIAGFNLFMGKAKCGTCHFMPLFNGTIPPMYNSSESEVIGVPADAAGTKPDTDSGRYKIYRIPQFQFSFKTPSVRNVKLTAPYMHNGVYKTLEEVMDFYNKGGGNGMGFHYEYQTLPEDKLNLSKDEIKRIIVFMGSLTDSTVVKKTI